MGGEGKGKIKNVVGVGGKARAGDELVGCCWPSAGKLRV
jgi:hypothetical protein